MKPSSALVTDATFGLGEAAAKMLAVQGWREIIVTGCSLARAKETAAQLAAVPPASLIPGMNQTPEIAARRHLQAPEFGTDVSGEFFASAQGKLTGPIEEMRHPHFHDRARQAAAWQAVVKASGVNLL